MKRLFFTLMACLFFQITMAQFLKSPADGGNKKASVFERIGITDIRIDYDRPALKGREGKIWGDLVHFGYKDLGFGTSKASPWRAGANENTVFTTSTDIKVEGKSLPAGAYGLFMAIYSDSVTVIFSKNTTSWGSYFYDTKEDMLRVTVKQEKAMPNLIEWLRYEFLNETANSAILALRWERWRIPFHIEVDVHTIVLDSFRKQLRNEQGFVWQSWNQAANYCLNNNINLEEGLQWAENAIKLIFVGEANFTTLITKAQLLAKLDKQQDAKFATDEAIKRGNMQELHTYGRQLLTLKRPEEALAIFKLNAERNPNQIVSLAGLARGYAANADFKNASKIAKQGLALATDIPSKELFYRMVKMFSEAKELD